jgi:hypothetical protein
MHQTKYKECSPQTTIANIKTILATHEVRVEEREWWNKEDSRWPKSIALHLKGLSFSVNGKGMDLLFAPASAYGEFMERFQNISIMKSRFRLDLDDPLFRHLTHFLSGSTPEFCWRKRNGTSNHMFRRGSCCKNSLSVDAYKAQILSWRKNQNSGSDFFRNS